MREFGELESAIMDVVSARGQAYSRTGRVRERLSYNRPLAYTTVMTVMNILYGKGVLCREKHGRAWRYWPAESREEHDARLVAEVLRSGGNEHITMMRFVERVSDRGAGEPAQRGPARERAAAGGLVAARAGGLAPATRRAVFAAPVAAAQPPGPVAGPNTSSRRCSRQGSVSRIAAVSAVSTSPTATPGNGPRSSRTVPIGSTSMLRPIPVGARVRGDSGSGTCPAAATQTVFSIARARTSVTQCSSLNSPAAQAAGPRAGPRPGPRDSGPARGNGCRNRSACPPGARRCRRGLEWTPGRPPWTRSRRASRTGGSSGTPRPAARRRRSRPPCCRAVRGGLEYPRDQGYPRAAGGVGQSRAERAVQRLRHGLQIRAEPGLGGLREHGQGGAVPCGFPEGPADPGQVHRRIRADGQLAERDPHGRSVNHRDVPQQGAAGAERRAWTCDLMAVWTDHC